MSAQPFRATALACSSVSTPSAIVAMPRLSLSVLIARMIRRRLLAVRDVVHEGTVDLDFVERKLRSWLREE